MSKTIAQHLTDEVPALHFIVFMHGFAVLADGVSCALVSTANRREVLVIPSVLPLLTLAAPVAFFRMCVLATAPPSLLLHGGHFKLKSRNKAP